MRWYRHVYFDCATRGLKLIIDLSDTDHRRTEDYISRGGRPPELIGINNVPEFRAFGCSMAEFVDPSEWSEVRGAKNLKRQAHRELSKTVSTMDLGHKMEDRFVNKTI